MADPVSPRIVVLVVDENPDVLAAYAEVLRGGGMEPLTASGGKAALETAFRLRPQLVLIDLWMPEKDGFETVRALRADARTAAVPIVAFTSLGYTQRKAVAAGCDALVRTSEEPELLLTTIRKLVSADTSRGQAADPDGEPSTRSRTSNKASG